MKTNLLPDRTATMCPRVGIKIKHGGEANVPNEFEELFPLYFFRNIKDGASDGTWHYRGELRDTARVFIIWHYMMLWHPILWAKGCHRFLSEIAIRIPQVSPGTHRFLSTFVIPVVVAIFPVFGYPLTAMACIMGKLFAPLPPLLRPFNITSFVNYCIMLLAISIFHCTLRCSAGHRADISRTTASKQYWRSIFKAHFGNDDFMPKYFGPVESSHLQAEDVPKSNFCSKPDGAGGGYGVMFFTYDAVKETYTCENPGDLNKKTKKPRDGMTRSETATFLGTVFKNVIIEEWVLPPAGLPVSSLRVMTLCFEQGKSELMCVSLLCAPETSGHTAHFHQTTYKVDLENEVILQPLNIVGHLHKRMSGTPVPGVRKIVLRLL